MIEQIKKFLGFTREPDYKMLVKDGAKIIDVRTPSEYSSGHIKGSINIPLGDLKKKIRTISQDEHIILCCASGMRSGSAMRTLRDMGYTKAYNGGGWNNLKFKVD